ncbi:MAG: prenyltransferase/squalene oxidase repeat-containing protein [Planctomycetota bacterium]
MPKSALMRILSAFSPSTKSIATWSVVWVGALVAPVCSSANDEPAPTKDQTVVLKQVQTKAIDYLRTKQSDDGSWTSPTAPGISGVMVDALLRSGLTTADPTVQKGLKHLETFIQPDGGIYFAKSNHRNYETCIAMLAFREANTDGRYKQILANADKYIRQQQWDEDEGKNKADLEYGGAGYGSKSRPDLSNTQFLLEALRAAGAQPSDPAVQKALVFVSRTQNLESEANTTPFSSKINDGGFYYTPAAGGSSVAGNADNGGLRSYGSMTYAGLKSMIYAGVGPNDPRVKAANTWIQKHYTVTENPGLDQTGLFYYHQTFAKTLDAIGSNVVVDANGKEHNWRHELLAQLAKTQNEDGSWVNKTPRWNEGDPNMATGFSLLALSYCGQDKAAK